MLRRLALSALLVPGLALCQGFVQGPALVQKDRTRALDGAAMTPFFTQKGADAVKKVVAGGAARKAEESVLDPAQYRPGQGMQPPQGQMLPGQPMKPQMPVAPVVQPTFAWRLVGISYGKRQGMALFQSGGKSQSVCIGATLDQDTKVIAVTRSQVVVDFHGKRLELSPW